MRSICVPSLNGVRLAVIPLRQVFPDRSIVSNCVLKFMVVCADAHPMFFFWCIPRQETSRPPFVDTRDIKRMLACPDEEMHKFSDPKNYRTRPRYTRLALPLREIEAAIQVRKS